MAVTVEGKLELFKKVLFENIEADWADKRNKWIEALDKDREEKIKEFEKKKKAINEEGKSRAEIKRRYILSKAQSDAGDEIMKKKESLLFDLIESLKSWSKEFIKDDKYKAFLKNNIEKSLHLMNGKNLLLSFTEKDMEDFDPFIKEQIEKFQEHKNIELAVSREDIIGGFTLEDRDSGVLADFSIKTLIDEGKEYMGKMLYEKLDEVLRA